MIESNREHGNGRADILLFKKGLRRMGKENGQLISIPFSLSLQFLFYSRFNLFDKIYSVMIWKITISAAMHPNITALFSK